MAGSKGKVCLASTRRPFLPGSLSRITPSCKQPSITCFLANVGQEEDWDAVEKKALQIGAEKMIIEDITQNFVDEFCWKAIACNAIYEDQYLLGTSLARPAIARAMMKAAAREGCDYVSHGCTGKGFASRYEQTAHACHDFTNEYDGY
ncbi:predicted protein [Verticillium alfalfae VaMs.102]|uniref:Predicted protein n=1 Tax=Verticillium alfalfae (strain VaMs.102 / ATCC MYA-4576 / FGSC 10136) TaxID=526221 RepID=C9SUN5_VERA1|nr:predicted protein [Verticillium alfalfae VaMs.102]EEY22145.1 predicted protein [Verticillium alfalfae VaMs.102]